MKKKKVKIPFSLYKSMARFKEHTKYKYNIHKIYIYK